MVFDFNAMPETDQGPVCTWEVLRTGGSEASAESPIQGM